MATRDQVYDEMDVRRQIAQKARREGFDGVAAWLEGLPSSGFRRATPAPAVSGERWEATEGLGIAAPYRGTGYQMLIATFMQQDKRDRAVQCVNALAGVRDPEKAMERSVELLRSLARYHLPSSGMRPENWRNLLETFQQDAREALALLGGED